MMKKRNDPLQVKSFTSKKNRNNKYKLILYTSIIFFLVFLLNLLIRNLIKEKPKIIDLFDSEIVEPTKLAQEEFCNNRQKYFDEKIENIITSVRVGLNKKFQMYVYKKDDYVSDIILDSGVWEKSESINMYKSIVNYKKNMNISNNSEITILDIGGNIGWFTFFFGAYGFNVYTFEPWYKNYYILLSSYCFNSNFLTFIINKGLYKSNDKCTISSCNTNIGDGIVLCEKKNISNANKENIVSLVKLDEYFPYLKNKKIALVKIDTEGTETDVLLGGLQLLKELKIPLIQIEYNTILLKKHGSYKIIRINK